MDDEYYIVGNGFNEYVLYYNPTGNVIHFTGDRHDALRCRDLRITNEVLRVARDIYKRGNFKRIYIVE